MVRTYLPPGMRFMGGFPLDVEGYAIGSFGFDLECAYDRQLCMWRDVCNGFTGGSVVEVLGDELREGQQNDPRMLQSR